MFFFKKTFDHGDLANGANHNQKKVNCRPKSHALIHPNRMIKISSCHGRYQLLQMMKHLLILDKLYVYLRGHLLEIFR